MNLQDLTPWRHNAVSANGGNEHPVTTMHREMDRLFSRFFNNDALPAVFRESGITPKLDISESDQQVEISVDLPGLEEKDIDISVSDGMLTIKGERKSVKEEKGKHHQRVERSYGAFERSLSLPPGIDDNAIKAVFRKGVLDITLPKKPEARHTPKKIEIKTD